ncbi:MAG TPA: ParB N-terminal domain-containing protein [Gemmatimonadaceae bacterium]|nr:ParB N-terminal domain-containing protein [Gemmatimonadaceae bacterium]
MKDGERRIEAPAKKARAKVPQPEHIAIVEMPLDEVHDIPSLRGLHASVTPRPALVASIKASGQIDPVVGYIDGAGIARIVDGRQRVAALRAAGRSTVRIALHPLTDAEAAARYASTLNRGGRRSAIELALALDWCSALLQDGEATFTTLASITGRSRTSICNAVGIARCLTPDLLASAGFVTPQGQADFSALLQLSRDALLGLAALVKSGEKLEIVAGALRAEVERASTKRAAPRRRSGEKEGEGSRGGNLQPNSTRVGDAVTSGAGPSSIGTSAMRQLVSELDARGETQATGVVDGRPWTLRIGPATRAGSSGAIPMSARDAAGRISIDDRQISLF